jgi:hypothetical protein
MSYLPKPIDVSQVSLSPDLLQLTKRLAKNTHELWSAQRLALSHLRERILVSLRRCMTASRTRKIAASKLRAKA